MTAGLFVRQGGAWVQADVAGRARLGGVDIPWDRPTSGTVDESFSWGTPLSSLDWADTGANVGTRFATSITGSWIGVKVWRPETLVDGQAVYGCNHDTGVPLTPSTPLAAGGNGGYVSTMFAEPVTINPGINYIATFATNRYGFSRVSDGATLPFTTTHLYTDPELMGAVAFYTYVAYTSPGSASPNFHFHVSPIVRYPA